MLPSFPSKLSAKAAAALSRLGVEIQTGATVIDVEPAAVIIARETGLAPSEHARSCGRRGFRPRASDACWPRKQAAEVDKHGRIVVQSDLTIRGHPALFVVGDLGHFDQGGKPLPGVAPVGYATGTLRGEADREPASRARIYTPSIHKERGSMAVIGRDTAVADLGWLQLSGILAGLLWLLVHLLSLMQFQSRLLVLMQWAWSFFSRNRSALLIPEESPRRRRTSKQLQGLPPVISRDEGSRASPLEGPVRQEKVMAQSTHFDVIIIGSGAGGGTLFHHLAPSGKQSCFSSTAITCHERDNWNSTAVFINAKYRAKETWTGKDGETFHPGIQYYVGGDTKVYGAALLHCGRKEDFGVIHHRDGISPAWPLSYEDYQTVLHQSGAPLSRSRGARIDPTGHSQAPYRYPPVSHEPHIQELHDDLSRLGHHPFPLPLGILLEEENGKPKHQSPCIRCDRFDGFPCFVQAKPTPKSCA